ncbi:uncharacterized protein LOC143212274 [Lasioglossum baleicum]|uniref:uncharacterized protein LOC143212274 n=1 Tax=Lasioglossum baleicum TaxID=434251 RepID=UPI003FCD915C
MFSRAAKSIVKTIGQRNYHAAEENIKVTLMGGAGEIGRTLSQMLKQPSKLNVLALYDVASLNKGFPVRFYTIADAEPPKPINSWMLTMLEKSRVAPRRQTMREPVAYMTNGPSNVPKNETDELVEILRRLPVAEGTVDPLNKSRAIATQGDNACFGHGILRGPRVLGEMGPDKARQGGRIVTEIYKQLPDLVDRLGWDRTKRGNRPALRQLSTFTMSTEKTGFEDEQQLDPMGHVDEIPATKAMEASNKRKMKENKRLCETAASIIEKSSLKDIDNRTERRKTRPRKLKEHKVLLEGSSKSVKRGSNIKSRNWTIPAALSDKKPKLLYGLVQQRRTPIAWFFSSLFETKKSDVFNDFQSVRQQSRMRKFDSVRERAASLSMEIAGGDRQEISASMTSLLDEPVGKLEVLEAEGIVEDVEEPKETIHGSPMQDPGETKQWAASSSSNETMSELSESPQALMSISSKLWQFLENLKTGRRKSSSLSSLTSYNLDSLFEEAAPIYNRVGGVRFFSKSDRSKAIFKDKLKNFAMKKNPGKSGIPAKKTEQKTEQKKNSSCASGDTCKLPERYGSPCKKIERDCGTVEDVCKKYRDEKRHGASCKGSKDPCAKFWKEKVYGKPCKQFQDDFGSDDPVDKFWKDKVYGKRCKKKESDKVCGNPKCGDTKKDPCGKKKSDPCGKSEKSDPCGKKKSDPCGKKPEPCGKKKSDPCGKKKSDPCGKKKSDPCGKKKSDPCGKKKSDPCGKKKSDPCGKKPDPCGKKKPDPCDKKKSPPCGKKEASKKEKGKECPPVFRAPGCPKDEKGGGGKCNDSKRNYSTDSTIDMRSSFFSKQDVLHGFPRIVDRSSMSELSPRIESRQIRRFSSSIIDR